MKDDLDEDKCPVFLYLSGLKGTEMYCTWTFTDTEKNKVVIRIYRF